MLPPHLLTLADLSAPQIRAILAHAYHLKQISTPWLKPQSPVHREPSKSNSSLNSAVSTSPYSVSPKTLRLPSQSLFNKTVALLFSKRSTRTRVAAETSSVLLGGKALFLGQEDIQMGVNESLRDTARIVGGMCEGIFARVNGHEDVEVPISTLFPHSEAFFHLLTQELAKYSPVPVINALSSLWHPTQTLACLLTLHEHAHLFPSEGAPTDDTSNSTPPDDLKPKRKKKSATIKPLADLRPLTVAYVGDSANVLHDMLVTLPRLGHQMRVATPENEKYKAPKAIWDRIRELDCEKDIWWGVDPKQAVTGADVVYTDTWRVLHYQK